VGFARPKPPTPHLFEKIRFFVIKQPTLREKKRI
jgi:hypothetical protein